jgi:hypothetical protein
MSRPLTNEEFYYLVIGMSSPQEGPFPTVDYNPDGDCIEVLLSGEDFYADWVNPHLTLYRSEATNEIVGAEIDFVTQLIRAGH